MSVAGRAEQASRIARYKALSDPERENVLFLMALTAGGHMDTAIDDAERAHLKKAEAQGG